MTPAQYPGVVSHSIWDGKEFYWKQFKMDRLLLAPAPEIRAEAGREVPMRTFMHFHHPDSHYFEGHPLQGTFALTFASIVLVGLIALAIAMVS